MEVSKRPLQHLLGNRYLRVALACALCVGLTGLGVVQMADWRAEMVSSAERSDAIGRERMLVVSIVEISNLIAERPDRFRTLSDRMHLAVDQWRVISSGGPELGLDMVPTGRVLEPWPEASAEFPDVEDDLTALVSSIRVNFASTSTPADETIARWQTAADELDARLAQAARSSSNVGRHDGTLLLAVTSILVGLVVAVSSMLLSQGRRRRTAAGQLLAAQAVETERARFERILDESPDDLVLFDELGEVVWCSAGLGLALGAEGRLDRLGLRSIVHEEDLTPIIEVIAGAYLTPDVASTAVCRISTTSGAWRTGEVTARNLIADPLVKGVVLVVRDVTDREAALAEQRRLTSLRAFLTDHASEVMIQLDDARRISYASPAIAPLLELQPDDVLDVPLEHLVAPSSRTAVSDLLDVAELTGAPAQADLELVGASDAIRCWVSASVRTVADGDTVAFHVSLLDISDRRRAELRLSESEALQRLILDSLDEGVVLTHRTDGVVAANRAAGVLVGVQPGREGGSRQVERGHVRVLELDGSPMAVGDSPASRVFSSGAADLERHLQMCWPDGSTSINLVNSIPCRLDDQGQVELVLTTFADVTRRLEIERELARLATIDSLTSLPNRRQLDVHLTKALARAARSGASVALLFIDLDGFKAVNDEHGHDIGDELLIAAGHRIVTALRAGDFLARLGGDEFVAVVEDIPVGGLLPLCDRLSSALAQPFVLSKVTVTVGGSVGSAESTSDCSAAELLAAADAAMYEAKRGRRAHALPRM